MWSTLVGALAALTMPIAIFATRYSDSYSLLQAGFAIPVALVLGAVAVILARRARALGGARLGHTGGTKVARLGRWLGLLGICLAASSTIAVSVYGLLVWVS